MGGLERQILRLIRASKGKNISYDVCYFGSDKHLEPELNDLGVRTVSLGSPSENHVYEFLPHNVWSAIRFLRQEEYDVLHCHTPLFVTNLGRICGTLANVPVVGTFHNTTDNFHPTMRSAERALRPLSVTNICVSRAVENTYNRSSKEYAPDIDQLNRSTYTVHNGIDVARFENRVRAADPDRVRSYWGIDGTPIFLTVGRYSEKKNQSCLVRAMADVVKELPEAHLLLVGSGERKKALKNAVAEHGLEDHVTITGCVPTVYEYYALADVFVLPSLTEGLSLVLLESMVAGLPVVATDVPGTSEVVTDGENGYLVSPNAPSELASAMVRLQSATLRRQFGERGHRRVSAEFDIQSMVNCYLDIYRRVA